MRCRSLNATFRTRRKYTAFSLIEVLCAIVILAVGLVGLTQAVTLALGSSKESELQTSAALIAAGQIEALRADGVLSDGETEGECGEGLSLYRWRQTVTSAGIDGLHEISVEVENSQTGRAIYELRTLLFEPPADSTATGTGQGGGSRKRRGA